MKGMKNRGHLGPVNLAARFSQVPVGIRIIKCIKRITTVDLIAKAG